MTANYVLLEKITVGSAGAASVTFSGIPQTGYTDLVLKASPRSSYAAVGTACYIRFNNDASNIYSIKRLQGDGSTVNSYSETGQGTINFYSWVPGSSATSNTFGNGEIYIPNYTSSNYKSVSCDGSGENNATTAVTQPTAGLYASTSAITSITLFPDTSFVQGSTFYLYGVAKLGTTPAIVPYATGGDTIMTDGTYWYHAFLSSGTFTPAKALSCDVLVVAGGGGGATGIAGGGGAGGLYYSSANSIGSGSAQTVTVGAGGAGSAATSGSPSNGTQGSNSVFGSLTAAVGGGYGAIGSSNGGSGGSGGGTRQSTGGGTATSGQGNAGGTSGGVSPAASGGGGGAGAVGGSGAGSSSGSGGAGVNTYSAWLSATGLGVSGYIAGGGGGGGYYNASIAAGAGGSGGGGAGSNGFNVGSAASGVANTGGGGGGGGYDYTASPTQGASGSGGSGIVIVRYAV